MLTKSLRVGFGAAPRGITVFGKRFVQYGKTIFQRSIGISGPAGAREFSEGNVDTKMAIDYYEYNPEITNALIRSMVAESKARNNPNIRRALQAVLRAIYLGIFTDEPTGKRQYLHWVRDALTPALDVIPRGVGEPVRTVSLDDAIHATLYE